MCLDAYNTINKINRTNISTESYISFDSNRIKIVRLTLNDLNPEDFNCEKNQQKICSISSQSSSVRKTLFMTMIMAILLFFLLNRYQKNKY